MKKFILILLVLCGQVFGGESVVTLWGETGVTPASIEIPCMVLKATYDAGSPSDFYATNGAALVAISGDLTFATLTIAGDFSDAVVGMFAYITGLTSTNDGYFEITTVTGTTSITIEGANLAGDAIAAGDDGDTLAVTIGGLGEIDDPDADDKFQALLDLMGSAVTSVNNLDILLNQSFTIDQTIDIDNISGTGTTRARLIGTTAAFVDDGTKVVIDTSTNLTGALWEIGTSQVNVQFYNITLDANDATANALRLLDGSGNDAFTIWTNCIFENATADVIANDAGGEITGVGYSVYFYNPIIRGGVGYGIGYVSGSDGRPYVFGGKIYDNTLGGIEISGLDSHIEGVQIYGNGDGIVFATTHGEGTQILNCTIDGNTGDAIVWSEDTIDNIRVTNCAITNNLGADFAPTADDYSNWVVNNCLINGNNTTYTPVIGIMTQANIQTGVPGYTDGTNVNLDLRDYTPTAISNLIDAGVGGTGDTIGALCATAGGAGGGMIIHPGMTGGIGG